MKTSFFSILAVLALFIFVGCQQEDVIGTQRLDMPSMTQEQLDAYNEKLSLLPQTENPISSRVPISYITTLYNGSHLDVDGTNGNVSDKATHQYFRFYANGGDNVTVVINRITCEMDPAFYLYTGQFTDTDLLPGGSFSDDELPPACENCFAYFDPHENFIASTGWYTLGVTDFANCGSAPFSYEIVVSGLSTFIVIDGCHTTVLNGQHNATTTMQQAIDNCLANSGNSAAFVACVTTLTNTWVSQGKITRAQKSKIVTCAQSVAF